MAQRKLKEIKADARLIDDLGGPTKVRDLIVASAGIEKMTRENVSRMKAHGIPGKWRALLANVARQHGVTVPRGFDERPWT